ncbi:MAG: DUF6268 family outer membrane beta-barrel protein [Bacteroidota bacterium]
MKFFLLSYLLLLHLVSLGQLKPDLYPEDLNTEEIRVNCYCKPGVENKSPSRGLALIYNRLGAGTYQDDQNTSFSDPRSAYTQRQNFEFKIKAPLILKDNFKLLLGYKRQVEYFDFNQFGEEFNFAFQELDEETLKSNTISLLVSRPLNETRYMIFRLSYGADGDYGNWMSFRQKYAIYKFFGLYAFKPNADFEWGIGVGATKNFRRFGALPFILYNRNFNKKWGIEAVLPGFVFGRYNINRNNLLLFGVEYESESFRIDSDTDNPTAFAYAYNHSAIRNSIRVEHRIVPWVWGAIRLGYQFNFNSEFDSRSDETTLFFADPTNAMFLTIGIFVSPEGV